MTKENYKRSLLFDILVGYTWKKKRTIRTYFCRNKMDILKLEHFIIYVKYYDNN